MISAIFNFCIHILGIITAGFIFLFVLCLILVAMYLCIACGVQLYNQYLKQELERMTEQKNEIQRNKAEISESRNIHGQE